MASTMQIAEVFGQDVLQMRRSDQSARDTKYCPFRDSPCTKGGRTRPLGICSYADATSATTVCPVRFKEGNRLFMDAGRLAFGKGVRIKVVTEFRLLRIPGTKRKIGKIDYVLARLDRTGKPVDFAALEVQSVYISGKTIKPAFNHYLETGEITNESLRRPDFRSSAQKRLMPQLTLKMPVFRRWGKKFFVAVDKAFYGALPPIKETSAGNSEITWLVYPFQRKAIGGYTLGEPKIIYTQWDEVLSALREGEPPEQPEVLSEIALQKDRKNRKILFLDL